MKLKRKTKRKLAAIWVLLSLINNLATPLWVVAQENLTPAPTPTPTLTPAPTVSPSVAPSLLQTKGDKPKITKNNFRPNESVEVVLGDYQKREPKISLFRGKDRVENIETKIENGNLKVTRPKSFKPGKYTIKISTNDSNDGLIEQTFTWGVLAVNTNKSIYLPNEQAYLQMASLDENGHTICNASLKLEIFPPDGQMKILSTQDGSIKYSETCGENNVTDNPDYFAYFQTKETGTYHLKLTNLDNKFEIEDFFEVKESVPFEVERIGATRINPFKANYKMSFKIKANEDFKGEVIETVPDVFNHSKIVWPVDWKAGENYELSYEYKAPKVSPQFYLLGPLVFQSEKVDLNVTDKEVREAIEDVVGVNKTVFSESREWQIASDVSNYAGPQIKTVEYSFGNSGNTTIGTGNTAYAVGDGIGGTSAWTLTPPAAASEGFSFKLSGTGIKIKQAWIEFRAMSTSNVSLSDLDFGLSTCPGSVSNCANAPAFRELPSMNNPAGGMYYFHTGEQNIFYVKTEATAAFNGLTDSDWANGVNTILRVGHIGPSIVGHTAKIYFTYESDYSATPHTETKTVRYVLDSDASGDTGSKTAILAVGGTQAFSYQADLDTGVTEADVLDVYFELNGQLDNAAGIGGTAGITAMIIGTGSTSPAYINSFPTSDTGDFFAVYRPPVGDPDFQINTAQKLNLRTTTNRVWAAGGELVVTYNYSTGAETQVDTVRYFVSQDAATTGVNKTTTTFAPVIANTGLSVKDIYVRAQTLENATVNLQIYGDIDATQDPPNEASNTYVLSNSKVNIGQVRILYDMSADAASFVSGRDMSVSTQWSGAGGDPVSLELFITFSWNGSGGGTQTKTVEYFAHNSEYAATAVTVAARQRNVQLNLLFPETVTKTLHSAYAEVAITSSDATTPVNVNMSLNNGLLTSGGTGFVSYIQDGEGISFYTLKDISTGVGVSAPESKYILNMITDAVSAFSPKIVVTYDVAYTETAAPAGLAKQIKTVEYSFGNSGNTTIGTGNTAYAVGDGIGGTSAWTLTPPAAASEGFSFKLSGTGIKIKQAWIEFRAMSTSNVSLSDLDFGLSTCPGSVSNCANAPAFRELPSMNNPAGGMYYFHTGEQNIFYVKTEATAAFNGLTDSDWANGVNTILRVGHIGPSIVGHTAKIYFTYESDYSATPHTETKTVRYVLDSDASGDTGSKTAILAVGGTQAFSYQADLDTGVTEADVLDVYFELNGQLDNAAGIGGTAGITAMIIGTGSTSPAYINSFPTSDTGDFFAVYRPPVGDPDFQINTAQKLNLRTTTNRVWAAGGELVVTYNYSTGAETQVDTVRYFVSQDAATTGVNKTTTTFAPVIANTGLSVKDIYVRAQTLENATVNLQIYGDIDATQDPPNEASNTYVLSNSKVNIGQVRILYDMSADAASFVSGRDMSVSTQWSGAGGDPVSLELFITFSWNGSGGGTQTKTVEYFAHNSEYAATAVTVAARQRNVQLNLLFPETVTKTLHSAYAEVAITSSDATTPVNVNMSLNNGLLTSGGTGFVSYIQDGEGISFYTLKDISTGVGVSAPESKYILNMITDAVSAFSPKIVVTYDVAYISNTPPVVVLVSPDNNAEIFDSTPAFTFTGTDTENDAVEYNIQLLGGGWDLTSASYDSDYFSVNTQEAAPYSVNFNTDGTKMYMSGDGTSKVYQYTLFPAWDVSTAEYDTVSFDIPAGNRGFTFSPDGYKFYALCAGVIYQYSMSTAWNLSTASSDSKNKDMTAVDVWDTSVNFNPDGTKMYYTGQNVGKIHQYSLSTPWDVTTASATGATFPLSTQDSNPREVFFGDDGTKLFMLGRGTNVAVYQYSLGTAWDVSTLSYDSIFFEVGSEEWIPEGMFIKPDGTKMYVIGPNTDTVYRYSLSVSVLLNKVSTTDTGFVNLDTGNTHPFVSGEDIQYTVQEANALDAGIYFWKVRGLDPEGTNTWGDWTATRSFSVIVGTNITISGNFYTNETGTVYNCSSPNLTVKAIVNGTGVGASGVCTGSGGAYTIDNLSVNSIGDVVTVFLDGETEKSTSITKIASTAVGLTLPLYQNRILLTHHGGGPVTNANIGVYDSTDDNDIQFTSNGVGLTVNSGKLVIDSGKSYTPGGNIDAPAIEVGGTFNPEANTITLTGSGTGTTCTDPAGTVMPFCLNSGTFNTSTSTVNFISPSNSAIYGTSYYNLGVGTSAETGVGATYSLAGNVNIGGTFTVGNTGSTNSDILDGSSYTLTLSGSGTPLNVTTKGTFLGSTSTVNYIAPAATTIAGVAYYNVGVGTSAETGVGATYSLGGNVGVGGTMTVGNTGSTNIDSLSAGSNTLTLSGTGTPFNLTSKGSFIKETSTVKYSGQGTTNINGITFNNLELSPTGGNPTYNLGLGTGQTVTASGNVTVGDGTNPVTVTTTTYSPVVNVTGNLAIGSSAELSGTGTGIITVNGNVTGVGTINLTGGNFEQIASTNVGIGTTSGANNWTFNNLTFSNSSGSPLSSALNSGGIGNLSIGGTLQIGKSTDSQTTTLDVNTNDRIIDANSSVEITNKGALSSSSASSFTIAEDFINNGTFTANSGTVTFDDALKTSNIFIGGNGSTNPFFNLFVSTGGKQMKFDETEMINVGGSFFIQGSDCTNRVFLDSTTNDNKWDINVTGSADVDYADIEDSNAIIALSADNSADRNNSGWFINGCVSSSATAYSFQRKTWYDGTRFWKSYNSDTNILFWYSLNGTTWIENTDARIVAETNDFSIEADSSNVFITYSDGGTIKTQKASGYPATNFSWNEAITVYEGSTWWNNNWLYKKPISIGYTGSALSDFQVRVVVNTEELINAGKMRADGYDIRFVDSSEGVSDELSYWIEQGLDTTSTIIWVKIASISTDKTIYLYYGNPSASTLTSNGNTTFNFFDDFLGDSLDTNKWTDWNPDSWGSMSVSGGILNISGYVTGSPTTKSRGIVSASDLSFPAAGSVIEIRNKWDFDTSYGAEKGIFISDGIPSWFLTSPQYRFEYNWLSNLSPKNYVFNINYVEYSSPVKSYTIANLAPANYEIERYQWYNENSTDYLAGYRSVDEGSNFSSLWVGATASLIPLPSTNRIGFSLNNSINNVQYAYLDWIRVRNYASSEPSVASPGNETIYENNVYPVISKDSNNKLWVVATLFSGTNCLLKAAQSSSANDVTSWVDSGVLDNSGNLNKFGTIVPIGAGSSASMYSVWIDGTTIEGKVYDSSDSQWEDSTGGTTYADGIGVGLTGFTNSLSTVADSSGSINLAYIDSSGHTVYRKYIPPARGNDAPAFASGFEGADPDLTNGGDGWNDGDFSGTSTIVGNSTTHVYSGTYAAKAISGGAAERAYTISTGSMSMVYARFYFYLDTETMGNYDETRLVDMWDSSWSNTGAVLVFRQDGSGNLELGAIDKDGTYYWTGSDGYISTGTWYAIEFKVGINASTGSVDLWLDGTNVLTQSNINTGSNNANYKGLGFPWTDTGGNIAYFDNAVFDSNPIGVYPWSSATTLDSNSGNEYPNISIDNTGSDGLYAFWIRDNDIFYKRACSDYTSWGGVQILEDTGTNNWLTTGYGSLNSGKIFGEWTSGTDPYDVLWDSITPTTCGGANQAPNDPTNLTQTKLDYSIIPAGTWINAASVSIGATASDPDASDTLYLCVENKSLGVGFTNVEDNCGVGVMYSGTAVGVGVTISNLADGQYHWQVKVKDAAGVGSSWVAFGIGLTMDFGVDTSAPSGGVVYDGLDLGVDKTFNNGSLSELSANWSGINADVSGLKFYEYSIGTGIGTTDIKNWTNVGTGTSAVASGLSLKTSTMYYYNVRATDNAGNIQTPVSSNGQKISPSLTFSVSPSVLTFDNLNIGNSFSSTKQATLTTSTNAYGGYIVRTFATDFLTSSGIGYTIPNFDGGTYTSPAVWGEGNVGFGYTSSDAMIQGSDKFNGATLFAPLSQTSPGDIVADYTDNVLGSPINDDQYTITYKVKTNGTQQAANYSSTVIYTVTAIY